MPSPEGGSVGFVTLGQAKLYYEQTGSGKSLVLAHAGIADCRMWDEQFSEFGQEIHVVRYDMRGFGKTTPGSEPFTDWQDLARLIESLKAEPATVVGSSMGAKVAIELSLMRPDLARALILVSPGLFDDGPRSDSLTAGWRQIEEALDAGETERAIEIETSLWVDGTRNDPGEVRHDVRRRVQEMNQRAWELAETANGRQDFSPPAVTRLREICAPTLVIAGRNDQPDIVTIARRVADEVSGAHLVIVEDAAHMLNMEHPALFNAVVSQFVRGLPPDR